MDNDNINNNTNDPEENKHPQNNPGEESPAGGNGNGSGASENTEPHKMIHLSGMYQDWFLDYASYVILERAVPHIQDGLKPVQRRILHTMKRIDDGHYNKVANIIGYTMQYHPHGDASIQEALIQLGQKDLLIDTQGNWGNIFTGDAAAAPRYIEARLTNFAREVVFNNKTTDWKLSYDGRNYEPVTLPVKFPLLLAQGVEGIAVGLASKILPHNFNELLDAAIAYLKNEDFTLYPDFPTGGLADFSRYNDGLRGGVIKVRAKISKVDSKTLSITDVPYGKTTNTLIDSIIKANDKGKIKIRRIDDNTAEHVEILVHLASGTSADKTIDALYAFTDCEVSISPNACVIENEKPRFLGVSDILKHSVDHTVHLLTQELQIEKHELQESWHMSSLEKIFIEQKIYNDIEECETWQAILQTIDKGLDPFKDQLMRKVTHDDIVKLTELRIKKISKYDIKKAEENIKNIEDQIEKINKKLGQIIGHTIEWFRRLKKKYGTHSERQTEIRNFHNIEATKVAETNKKLYVNRAEGFIGTGLKKDEYVCECSDIDDIIVFLNDGRYYITKVDEKVFVGKNIFHARVFKKNDTRTIYNIIYRDGYKGKIMAKRTAITKALRDKTYDITKGSEGSELLYLSANPNGEAEVVTIYLKHRPRLKKPIFDFDFGKIAIKGKNSQGNVLTRYPVHKIVLKEKGESTLGGQQRWFDFETLRLNQDGNGIYLGEFWEGDKILIITNRGTYKFTNYDITNHYEDEIYHIEKYDPDTIFTAVYFDGEQNYHYIKRFQAEKSEKEISFIGDHPQSRLILLSKHKYPRLEIQYEAKTKKGKDQLEAEDYIAVKGVRARGKRLTNHNVKAISELEPAPEEEADQEESATEEESATADSTKDSSSDDSGNSSPGEETSQMYFDW